MNATENHSVADKEFLAQCEEEFKERYTEKDLDFMKVYNADPSIPPIIHNWYPQNSGRRNDRRNRNWNQYDRQGYRNNEGRDNHYTRDYQDRSDHSSRGYKDYRRHPYARNYRN